MWINFSCGYSSETLAKVTAYIDLALASLTALILYVLWELTCGGRLEDFRGRVLTRKFLEYHEKKGTCRLVNETHDGDLRTLVLGSAALYCVGTFVLALVLLYAANYRHLPTLRRWFGFSIFLLLARSVLFSLWIWWSAPKFRIAAIQIAMFNTFFNAMELGSLSQFYGHLAQERWRGKRYNYRTYY